MTHIFRLKEVCFPGNLCHFRRQNLSFVLRRCLLFAAVVSSPSCGNFPVRPWKLVLVVGGSGRYEVQHHSTQTDFLQQACSAVLTTVAGGEGEKEKSMVRVYCRPGPPGPADPPGTGTHTLDGIFPNNCMARHCLTRSPVQSPAPLGNRQVLDRFNKLAAQQIRNVYLLFML